MYRYSLMRSSHGTASSRRTRLTKRPARLLILTFLALVTTLGSLSTAAAVIRYTPPTNGFNWSMDARFGMDRNNDGLVDYHYDPEFIRESTFGVNFNGCPTLDELNRSASGTTVNSYKFSIDGAGSFERRCKFSTSLAQGPHTVMLDMEAPNGNTLGHWEQQVTIKDHLIVSLGDSFASGEGNPDVPQKYDWTHVFVKAGPKWVDKRCHRSAYAGPALAARALEDADPHSSVTFLSLACSGATISTPDADDPKAGSGMLGGYAGIEPGGAKELLPPQVEELRRIVGAKGEDGAREIDHLLISIGGNDLQFTKLIKECTFVISCYDEREHPEIVKRLRDRTAELPHRYAALAAELKTIPSKKVYLTEYPNLVLDDNGNFCNTKSIGDSEPLLLGVTAHEIQWLYNGVLGTLNKRMMPQVAARYGWSYIGGVERLFGLPGEPGGHGFCADKAWFRHSPESLVLQGPDTALPDALELPDTKGTIHPNLQGQLAYKQRILAALNGETMLEVPTFTSSFSSKGWTSKISPTGWIIGACNVQNQCFDTSVAYSVGIDDPTGIASVTATINGSSGISGIEELSETHWEAHFDQFRFRPGVNQIEVTAIDREGYSSTHAYELKWDFGDPYAYAQAERKPDVEDFYNAPVDITLNGRDIETSPPRVRYQINGGAWTEVQSGTKMSLNTDGTHTIMFYAIDAAGRTSEDMQTLVVKLDLKAPVTHALISPKPNAAGWSKEDSVVTLQTDDGAGIGTASITYGAVGAQPMASRTVQAATELIKINRPGTTTISFFASDRAGNIATPGNIVVKLDKVAPVVTLTAPAAELVVQGDTITVAGTVTDKVSVARVEFLVDDVVVATDSTAPYAATLDATKIPDGARTVALRAFDQADNATTKTRTIYVNRVSDTFIKGSPARTTSLATATFGLGAWNANATFVCSLDAAAFTPCQTPKRYTGLAQGAHTFRVRSTTGTVMDATPAIYSWQIIPAPAASTVWASPEANPDFTSSSSVQPSLSANGRFVAFQGGLDLIAGDTNGVGDIFVRDRDGDRDGIMDEPGTSKTVRVSVTSAGVQANGLSARPAISADGRYVAFESAATNLVAGDTNAFMDIFLHDRDTDNDRIFDEPGAILTRRVSVSSGRVQGNAASEYPAISGNGRYVVFESGATSLVPNDNASYDIFAFDQQTSLLVKISVTGKGESVAGGSYYPSISDDGRFVAFMSSAAHLVSNDNNSAYDIYVHDRDNDRDGIFDEPGAMANTHISVTPDGKPGNRQTIKAPAISANGRYVVFNSQATNIVHGDLNNRDDVFVRDRDTDADGIMDEQGSSATMLVSVSNTGEQANSGAFGEPGVAISGDGRYVVFLSDSTNLVAEDTNNASDVFVRDTLLGLTDRVSLTNQRTQVDWRNAYPAISSNGGFIGYESESRNMVPEDNQSDTDIYVTRREIVAPDTMILTGSAFFTSDKAAVFTFAASETPVTYTCSIDNGAYTPCTSGRTYTNLVPGEHMFQVRATDAAGNTDPLPAVRTWTIR